jgi:DNA-binding MarR family transcriptional regulator
MQSNRDREATVDDGVEALSDQVLRLTRTAGALRSQLAARHTGGEDGTHGIEWAAYALLFQLVTEGPKRSSTLAEAVCVDPSTVSRQVAELVKAGLVERVPDPADGRASLLVATERGRDVYAARKARRVATFGRIVSDWPDDDVAALTDLLVRFNDSFVARRAALLEEMAPAVQAARPENSPDTRPVETSA